MIDAAVNLLGNALLYGFMAGIAVLISAGVIGKTRAREQRWADAAREEGEP